MRLDQLYGGDMGNDSGAQRAGHATVRPAPRQGRGFASRATEEERSVTSDTMRAQVVWYLWHCPFDPTRLFDST